MRCPACGEVVTGASWPLETLVAKGATFVRRPAVGSAVLKPCAHAVPFADCEDMLSGCAESC